MILLADLHLGLQQDNSLWHNTSINLAAEIHDLAIKNNENTIAVLGDIFDNRKFLNQKTYNVARKIIIDMWSGFNVILVRGNHDTYYKDLPCPHWLEMFSECDNIVLVDKDTFTLDNYCFVPWGYDVSNLPSDVHLFGHFEINNFRMNNFYECKSSDISSRDFSRFKSVYSGHFHFPQSNGNITYLGSPFQQNFGDVGSKRGYYILHDGGGLEFIEFTKAPKFVILKTNSKYELDFIKGNIVKLVFDKDYGTRKNNELVERMELMEPSSWTIDTTNFSIDNNSNEEQTEDVSIKDTETLLRDYIDSVPLPEHLNKKTIIKMTELLIKEISLNED